MVPKGRTGGAIKKARAGGVKMINGGATAATISGGGRTTIGGGTVAPSSGPTGGATAGAEGAATGGGTAAIGGGQIPLPISAEGNVVIQARQYDEEWQTIRALPVILNPNAPGLSAGVPSASSIALEPPSSPQPPVPPETSSSPEPSHELGSIQCRVLDPSSALAVGGRGPRADGAVPRAASRACVTGSGRVRLRRSAAPTMRRSLPRTRSRSRATYGCSAAIGGPMV